MTKRKFLFAGLFLVALSAFWISLETYFLLSTKNVEFSNSGRIFLLNLRIFLLTLGTPILFCVVLWQRLRFTGRSRPISAIFIAMFFVLWYYGMFFGSSFLPVLNVFNPVDTLMEELRAWSAAGYEGVSQYKLRTILKMSAFNGMTSTITGNWTLLLALILGAFDPWCPRRVKVAENQSGNAALKRKSTYSAINRMIPQISTSTI